MAFLRARFAAAVASSTLLFAGCALDRSGLAVSFDASARDAARVDAPTPGDSGLRTDGSRVDAGERPGDAASCGLELCDGQHNGCDPSAVDGADEPWIGLPCDGPDADRCADGMLVCANGGQSCTDDAAASIELCDGRDNDCEPMTPDGSGEPGIRAPCDGPDADQCANGVASCIGGVLRCTENDPRTEDCNARDDDCDGTIDEGDVCPCPGATYGAHRYLFCEGDEQRDWEDARDFCSDRGFHLVAIDDLAEQRWVSSTTRSTGGYWIGATDRDDVSRESVWVWESTGAALQYTAWATGEPNNSGASGGEDCAEMVRGDRTPGGVEGAWNDQRCNQDRNFICEAAL